MQEVESPCVRNCCLDEDKICLGCFRSMAEIMKWGEATNAERRAILRSVNTRRLARQGEAGSTYDFRRRGK